MSISSPIQRPFLEVKDLNVRFQTDDGLVQAVTGSTFSLEKGRTQVVVMDVLGREIARLYDGEIESGAHTLSLNTSGIAAGSYYLSLVTPTVRRFARVDIAR